MKKIFICFCLALLFLSFASFSKLAVSCSAVEKTEETDTVPSRNYTVVIDPGHGGADPGSIGYKTKVHEADLNLKLSKMLKTKLEDSGINVVMTRETEASLANGTGKAFKKS